MSDLKNHIAHFWAFNNSSVANAKSTFYYLVFMFYLLLIVVSTTDAMILIPSSTVKLPVLNIPLPLWEFYLILPPLVVILHFNLLYNLIQHSKKLHCYQKVENDQDGLTVFPLVINFVLSHKKTPNSLFMRGVMWLLIFAFPMILLCLIQWNFSAYHSASMTFWHFGVVVLDALVLMFTWHKIFNPPLQSDPNKTESNNQSTSNANQDKKVKRARLGELRIVFKVMRFSWWATIFVSFAFFNLVILLIFKNTDGSSVKNFMPHLQVKGQVLIKSRPSDEIIQRFLALGKSKEAAYYEYTKGINLGGRDLRYCDFSGAYLVNVNLQEADLRGANFSLTELHGGILTKANLSKARFHYTKMHYVKLEDVKLRETTHKGLDLRNATLINLDLSKLKLEAYNLEGAVFEKINFENADLRGLPFTGATFTECFIKAAQLNKATMNGVLFVQKNNLEGTDLSEAQLKAANLNGVSLNGANLSNARLEGAVWQRDTVQGVNLRNASLQGANLNFKVFSGNLLAGAKIKGLNPHTTKGNSNYYYGLDSTENGNWREIEKKLVNVNGGRQAIKEAIMERIADGKKRVSVFDSTAYREYFGISNGDDFIKARQAIACQNVYVAEGILLQNALREQNENERVRQELVDYLRNNCALIYDKIVKRGRVKVN